MLMIVVSLIIPVYNESALVQIAVAEILSSLDELCPKAYEIWLCENGSTDETCVQIERLLVQYGACLKVCHLPVADYGAAVREGLTRAAGERVVLFDLDGYNVAFLQDVLPLLGPHYDLVVGAKTLRGSQDQRSVYRRLASQVFSRLVQVVFSLPVSDTHGMKGFYRPAVAALSARCRFTQDVFDTELIIRMKQAGLRVGQLPISVVEKRPSRTSLLGRVPRTLYNLFCLRVQLWREYDEP